MIIKGKQYCNEMKHSIDKQKVEDLKYFRKLTSIMDEIFLKYGANFIDVDIQSRIDDDSELLIYRINGVPVEMVVDMNFELAGRCVEENLNTYRLIGRFDYV